MFNMESTVDCISENFNYLKKVSCRSMRLKLFRNMCCSQSWWALSRPYCHCIIIPLGPLYHKILCLSLLSPLLPQPTIYLFTYLMLFSSNIWCTISKLRRATSKQVIGLKAIQILYKLGVPSGKCQRGEFVYLLWNGKKWRTAPPTNSRPTVGLLVESPCQIPEKP